MIYGKTIEQISQFGYLRTSVSCNKDRDIETKIQRYQYICGTINIMLTEFEIFINYYTFWMPAACSPLPRMGHSIVRRVRVLACLRAPNCRLITSAHPTVVFLSFFEPENSVP